MTGAPPPGPGPAPDEDRREVVVAGRRIEIRPARPEDVAGLDRLFGGLALEDRHRRFFSAYRPTRRFLEALAATDESQGVQLVAVLDRRDDDPEHQEGEIVGEAGYRLLHDGDGELAITVAADRRGWLGPFLLDALVAAAARRGVPGLEADVLLANRRMLALLHARGEAFVEQGDPGILRVLIGTGGDVPTWPPDADGPRVLVEGVGGTWRGAAEARRRGSAVLTCPGPGARRKGCPALRGEPCPLAVGADVIVVPGAPSTPELDDLATAHRALHPGVPVCLEVAGPDALAEPVPVELVQRLATEPTHS